jgi:hypothetical protein
MPVVHSGPIGSLNFQLTSGERDFTHCWHSKVVSRMALQMFLKARKKKHEYKVVLLSGRKG